MPLSLVWDLVAVDKASGVFGRVSGAATAAATSTERAVIRYNTAMRSMAATGAHLTRSLTLPLAIIGGLAVKAATDFNASMTRIQTQAGGSARDVRYLSKQVLAMRDAQQGPNELATALYHLKSVGLGNVAAMKALRQASDFAAVGHANLEDTTNALAGAWRTGIRGATNFHQAVATLNAVVGAGNMKLEDLNAALGTGILPSAKTFGLTLKDVGSALALFTDEGVPAEVAATRLRMSFSLLGAPSAKAASELKDIGLTGLRLANDMRKPDGLIRAIGDLKTHLEDPKFHLSLSEQAQLLSHAFGGGRSSSAILSLINNFDVLKRKQDQVTNSMGRFDQAVKTQQQTPEAKFKLLEASLGRAAVLLGNQLLPIVTSIAQTIAGIAEKFNGLSSGTKKFIVDAGLALLVLGPMLNLVGRIGLAFGSLFLGVTRLGNGLARMSGGVGGATRGFAGLIGIAGGAAIGFAFGKLTEHASAADQALGALGATAAGAAIGLGIGGPVGAAVGGLAGLIGDLATRFLGAAADAKQLQAEVNDAMARNTSATDTFNNALRQTHNLLKRATTDAATHNLQNFKLDAFRTPGQAPPNALEVAGELGLNLHTFSLAATGNVRASNQMRAALAELYKTGAITADGWRALSGAIGQTSSNFAGAARTAVNLAHAHAKNFASLRDLNKEVKLYGNQLDLSGANLIHFSKAVSDNTAAGVFNRAWILDELGLLDKHATAMARDGKSVGASVKWFDAHSSALQRHLIKLGFDKQGVKALFDTFGKPPKAPILDAKVSKLDATIAKARGRIDALKQSKKPGIDAEIERLRTKIHTAQAAINSLHGKRVEVDIAFRNIVLGKPPSYAGRYTGGGDPGVIGATASGTSNIPEGYSTVGERGWELIHRQGNQVSVYPNHLSKLMTGWNRVPGFANGTTPATQSMNTALGQLVGLLRAFLAPRNLASVATSRAQFGNLLGPIRAAGGSSALINRLRAENTALDEAIRKRTADANRLAKAQQILNSVATATKAGFDITTAGANPTTGAVTFGGLKAQQLQERNIIAKWAADLRKIGKIFGKTPAGRQMLLQLAQSGPSSFPQVQALAAAGPAALASIVATQRQIDQIAGTVGGYISTVETGGTIRQHQLQLKRDTREVEHDARILAHSIVHAFKTLHFRVEFNAQGIARLVAVGNATNARRR